jgi:hypothetical protein
LILTLEFFRESTALWFAGHGPIPARTAYMQVPAHVLQLDQID